MKIGLLADVSKEELSEIKQMIGEAFVTNELFHEFGELDKRRENVISYSGGNSIKNIEKVYGPC